MSEDEGTDATAQGVPSEEHSDDDPADSDSAASGDEPAADVDGETDAPADDGDSGAQTDGESTADADAEAASRPETSDDVQQLLDRVTEYDDELAHKVNAIVEEARDLNGTVSDQRDELEDLTERVEEQASTIERLQTELEARDQRLEEYEDEVEDLKSRLKRKQADFQNYKKRAKKRQEQIKDRATEDLVERLLGVRDNLKRALEEESGDADSLRDGVEMTLKEFDRILEDENVSEIDPEPGTETDPQRHEVMMRVDSAQPEGTVADVYTPGYEMGDKVIQNAQVTVSNGELEDEDDAEYESAGSAEDGDAAIDDGESAVSAEGDEAPGEDTDDTDANDEGDESDGSDDAIELGGEVAEADDLTDDDSAADSS